MGKSLDEAKRFRDEAEKRKLVLPCGTVGPKYEFWLNQGRLSTRQEPKIVYDLVKLAREYAMSDNYGEHNDLLHLVANESEIGQRVVIWQRPSHCVITEDSKEYKSLRNFLEESGFDMKEVYREK